jgi:hypothetical protein
MPMKLDLYTFIHLQSWIIFVTKDRKITQFVQSYLVYNMYERQQAELTDYIRGRGTVLPITAKYIYLCRR